MALKVMTSANECRRAEMALDDSFKASKDTTGATHSCKQKYIWDET